jgi:hypothetical protein
MTKLITLTTMTLLLSNIEGMQQKMQKENMPVLQQQLWAWSCVTNYDPQKQRQEECRQKLLNEQRRVRQLQLQSQQVSNIKQVCSRPEHSAIIIQRFYEYFVPTKYNP